MATIVVHPGKEQLKAVKAILKALKIPLEEKKDESLPDYVIRGIKESQIQVAKGNITKYTTVDNLLGL